MSYGRLDVFWPDGLLQTYTLSEPTVSIGRSSGNTIALDTSSISRYHLTLTYKDNAVFLTDLESVNGTFIDGVKLESNKPQRLEGGEEIMIGDLRLIFNDVDDSPTRPIVAIDDTDTNRIQTDAAAFYLDIEGPDQAVAPGAHISARLTITNTGDEPERFSVETAGLPREWVRIDRPQLEVGPGAAADVNISFRPIRRSDTAPGDYNVQVTVRPVSSPEMALQGAIALRVLPYSGFGVALASSRLRTDETFRLHVHNQGSSLLPITTTGRAEDVRFTINPAQMTLAPGQRAVISGQVRPERRQTFGEPRTYPFDLVVRSGDAAGFTIALRGYLLERPPLPRWAPLVGAGVGAVVLAVIVFVAFLLLRGAPAPEIQRFEVLEPRVYADQTLQIEYAVANAESVSVEVNGQVIDTLESVPSGRASIPANFPVGENVITLRAQNGDTVAEASQAILILQPRAVEFFASNPPQVTRYVNTTITLLWRATGAESVTVQGLDAFAISSVPTALPAEGQFEVQGLIDTGGLPLVLAATYDDGFVADQLLTIPIVDPRCRPASGALSLHATTNAASQVISTVQPGGAVVVDARTSAGDWLRVPLPGGAYGWGQRASLTCEASFVVDNLRVAPADASAPGGTPAAGTPAAGTPAATSNAPAITAPAAATIAPLVNSPPIGGQPPVGATLPAQSSAPSNFAPQSAPAQGPRSGLAGNAIPSVTPNAPAVPSTAVPPPTVAP